MAGRDDELGAWLAGRSAELARLAYQLTADEPAARRLLDTALTRTYRRRRDRDGIGPDAIVRQELRAGFLAERRRTDRREHRGGGAEQRPLPPPAATSGPPPDAGTAAVEATWTALARVDATTRAALVLADASLGDPPDPVDLAILRREIDRPVGPMPATGAGPTTAETASLLAQTLADPRFAMPAPIDLGGLPARLRQRGRRRAAVAVVVVAALGVGSGVVVASSAHRRPPASKAVLPPLPPAGRGYLDWAPRGPLLQDAALLRSAAAAWRSAGGRDRPGSDTYVVWAGRVSGRFVVVLQALTAGGRLMVAQLGGPTPADLSFDQASPVGGHDLPALVLSDVSLPVARPSSERLLLLLAPALSDADPVLAAAGRPDVWLRDPAVPPTAPGAGWRTIRVDNGVTTAWVARAPAGSVLRVDRQTAAGYAVRMLRAVPGSLVPADPPVQQLPDPRAGVPPPGASVSSAAATLAPPDVVEDALLLARRLPGRTVTTVQALAVVPGLFSVGFGAPLLERASLLLATGADGGVSLGIEVRRAGHEKCGATRVLPGDLALATRPFLGAVCIWPDSDVRGRPVLGLTALGWLGRDVANVRITVAPAHPGEQVARILMTPLSTVSTFSGAIGTVPTGRATWAAYDAAGALLGSGPLLRG